MRPNERLSSRKRLGQPDVKHRPLHCMKRQHSAIAQPPREDIVFEAHWPFSRDPLERAPPEKINSRADQSRTDPLLVHGKQSSIRSAAKTPEPARVILFCCNNNAVNHLILERFP